METSNIIQLDFGFDLPPQNRLKKSIKSFKKQQEDFVFYFMDCLTSPIIVFESPWKDTIPKDILNNIPMARLLSAMAGEKKASLTEALVYIYPRTLEAPMHREWANIYGWLNLQYAKSHKSEETVKLLEEIAPKELNDYEIKLLDGLRYWIYDKRRKALKARMKTIKSTPNKPTAKDNSQNNLFDSD